MAKVRVYELARELNEDNRSLERVIRNLGIPIKNYMSTLTPEEATRVRATVRGVPEEAAKPAENSERVIAGGGKGGGKKSGGTVIRRRGADVRRRRAERAEAEAPEAAAAEVASAPAPAAAPVTRRRRPEAERPAASSGPASAPVTRRPSAGSAAPAAQTRPEPAAARPTRGESVKRTVPPSERKPAAAAQAAAAQAAAERAAAAAAEPKREAPKVGERIALPSNTRRLPGGMASRLQTRPGSRAAAGGAQAQPIVERKPSVQTKAAPAAEAAPAAQAPAAAEPSSAEAPAQAETAAAAAAKPAAADAAAAKPAEAADDGGRRVVRNEDGVIVGAASQRSEPKILGFIQIPQKTRKQQVIITDANEQEKMGRASIRKQREERHQARGRRKPPRRGGRGQDRSGPPKINTVAMSDEKKRIRVDEAIQVADLAHQMGKKASAILRTLWGMGMRGITINNAIDFETAEMVAGEFGYTAENVAFDEAGMIATGEEAGEPRAPVVTVMGHVDHGKTSLLDYIRKSRVAAGEAGGITQHVAAYKVETAKGEVTFLDTPGHEAFTAMRSRGAQVTDIVVLVVAADDGVMPTTVEAIKHSKEAGVPIVVAVNKIDKPEANSGRVKQALMEYELVGEEFGGNVPIIEVSAKTGQGVEDLLETLALQAEVLELRAPVEGKAAGTVLEARIDKGRGTVVTVLVQSGTLNKGDIVVANEFHAKVRGLSDQNGKRLKSAGPSTPVEVLGLSGVPLAGDNINVVDNDKDAKALVAHRREKRLRKESVRSGPSITEMMLRKKVPVLKVVLKADVQGSAQALAEALEEITNETEKVKLEVIKAEVGQINETDVKYAHAGDAVIFGFNVKTAGKAAPVAESEGVTIHTFSVIYEALDKARELMVGLLEPEYREREQGEAEVRALFPIPRLGVVAGCRVVRGSITRNSHVRVVRDGEVLHSGMIGSLRVHKDDVKEVKDGFECGIVVDGFTELEEGDTLQAFEMEAIPPTL